MTMSHVQRVFEYDHNFRLPDTLSWDLTCDMIAPTDIMYRLKRENDEKNRRNKPLEPKNIS
jgi:hypothetical protein